MSLDLRCLAMRVFILFALLAATVFQSRELVGQENTIDDPPGNRAGDSVSDHPTTGETSEPSEDSEQPLNWIPRLNLPLKTAGGAQLWTDHVWRDGYRIQQNSLTGHWRLVDANDVRRAWGNRTECEAELERIDPTSQTLPEPRHVVILLHGLMRTHYSMKPLEESLRADGHRSIVCFSYASARSSIADHAAALRELLEGFAVDDEFSFVGHSMGNIVVRHTIGDLQRDGDPKNILPRCRSMVMLGPPNQGAAIARRLAPTGLYEIVTGKGGMELGPLWEQFEKNLATPPFPFAIVAGDISGNFVQNPLVDGSSDFVVSLDEAKLDGAESFHTVPVLHSFLMNDERAKKLTAEFIDSHPLASGRN